MPPITPDSAAKPEPLVRIICIGDSVQILTLAKVLNYTSRTTPATTSLGDDVDFASLPRQGKRKIYDLHTPADLKDAKRRRLLLVLHPHDEAPAYGTFDGAADYRHPWSIIVGLKKLAQYGTRSGKRQRAGRLRIVKYGEEQDDGRTRVGPRQPVAWLIQPPTGTGQAGVPTILIYAQPDLSNLMRDIPDSTPWTELCLAGKHDSGAFYGVPYTQCQKGGTSITQQLQDGMYQIMTAKTAWQDANLKGVIDAPGIRYLDIRIRVVGNDLILYHGPVSQRAHFPAILDEIYAFLSSHPSESILITLKEEIPPNDPNFARMVWNAIEPGDKAGFWYRQPRVPNLGEVRGKAILMSRFAQGKEWEAGVGWAPSWPNNRKESETELTADGSGFRLQDWYDIGLGSMQEKADAVTSCLAITLTSHTFSSASSILSRPRTLTLSYASGGSIPFAPPCTIACGFGFPSWGLGMWGVNHRLIDWLLDLIAFDAVGPRASSRVTSDTTQRYNRDAGVDKTLEMKGFDKARTTADTTVETEDGTGMRRIRGVVPLDFYQDADGKGSAVVELLSLMNEAGMDDVELLSDDDAASDDHVMESQSEDGETRPALEPKHLQPA